MSSLRSWATPLTIGSFVIMGTTGVLMFFHADSGLNKVIHEWAGWAMVIGVGAHLVLNWRAFTTYFKRPVAKAIMGGGVALLALSFVPVSGGESPVGAVMRGLEAAPIEKVIALTGLDGNAGLAKLEAAGVEIARGQTIAEAAGGDRGTQMKILSVIFSE